MADTVTPASVTVNEGKAQGFALAVSWEVEPPGVGSIDSTSGLYQAPSVIAAEQEVHVVAQDANGREIGRAVVTLVPADATPQANNSSSACRWRGRLIRRARLAISMRTPANTRRPPKCPPRSHSL
jgi:hypothetical protein